MSQTASADDTEYPPFTKVLNMTIIMRVLFTLLKHMELIPSGF